jgi:hypothetical protein
MEMMKSTRLCLCIHQSPQFQGSYKYNTHTLFYFNLNHLFNSFAFNMFIGKASQRKVCHGCHHCQTVHILMLFLRLRQSTETELITKKFEHSHYGNVLIFIVCAAGM